MPELAPNNRFNTKPSRFLGFFLLLATSATFPVASCAQNPLGALRGTVQDSSGARIAGAKISATDSGKSAIREVQADGRGEFQVEQILPGSYLVIVSAGGFAPASARVVVAVSSIREITITLHPKSASEKIM